MEKKRDARERIDMRAPAEWVRFVAREARKQKVPLSRLIRRGVNAYLRSLGLQPPDDEGDQGRPEKP